MSHEVAGCLLSDCILPPLHRYIMYIHTHTYIHTYGCTYCTRYLTAFSSRFPPRGHPCACVLQGGVQGRVGVLVRCRGGLHGLPQHTSALRRVPPGDFLRRAESQSELQAGLLCGPSRGDRLLRICPAGIRREPGRRRASGEVGQIGLSVCMCYYHYYQHNHHSHNHHCRLPHSHHEILQHVFHVCRYFALVVSGKVNLPSQEEMRRVAEADQKVCMYVCMYTKVIFIGHLISYEIKT